jgi:sugar phosphate isomerase/epimerase
VTQPGIPNEYSLSTSCYGTRLATIEDQAFGAVAMGFRRIELGLSEVPVSLNGFEETRRETGVSVVSVVAGFLNPRSENMSGTKLGSLDPELRERALFSCRRHAQLAERYGASTVVLRGCEVESERLRTQAEVLQERLLEEGPSDAVQVAFADFVTRSQRSSQLQVEHLCRSIHELCLEFPEIRFAIEPGGSFIDILNFEAMGWVLEDLSRQGPGYWHDTGAVQLRQRVGLPGQGAWLEQYGDHLVGIHLQDSSEDESEMPPGLGEVDFKLVAEYVPSAAEKVIDIGPRHGRSEILAAVQFLSDRGF